MKELIIHFGMHKTGSSSIQRVLFDILPREGVVYLNPGYPNSSGFISSAFLEKPELFHGNWKKGLSEHQIENKINKLLGIIESGISDDADKYIISAEDFCRLSLSGFARFIDFASTKFHIIRAIGYVRSPKSFMESYFQQAVKDNELNFLSFDWLYPNYRRRFEKFEAVLGRDNVTYVKFNSKTLKNGCVVRDFCSRIPVDIKSAHISRINDGLSLPALKFLWIYRRLGSGYGVGACAIEKNKKIIRVLSKIEGPKVCFSWKSVRPILDFYADDIAWMESRLGESIADPESDCVDSIINDNDLYNIDEKSLKRLSVLCGGFESLSTSNNYLIVSLIDKFISGISNSKCEFGDMKGGPNLSIRDIRKLFREVKLEYPDGLFDISEDNAVFLLRVALPKLIKMLKKD
jgi:hypothetical protein